jgi:glucosamine--fructose-6-phosphate aminotransferase (isomerizing)
VLAVSQSGRSPDLVEPVIRFRRGGVTTVALVNEAWSPLAQAAEWLLPLRAGPERSVAATKSFVASLAAAARLTAAWCEHDDLRAALGLLPPTLSAAARQDWSRGVEVLAGTERLMVISRGLGLPVAQEAALKLKETCGIQAEAFSGAEAWHGPMALVGEGYPVLVLALRGPAQAQLLELAGTLRDRGARVLLAAPPDVAARDLTLAPAPVEELDPLTAIQSFYPMVEAVARARGRDPDRPPHLNKVTETR